MNSLLKRQESLELSQSPATRGEATRRPGHARATVVTGKHRAARRRNWKSGARVPDELPALPATPTMARVLAEMRQSGKVNQARQLGFDEIKRVGQGVDPELDREVALLIENPMAAFRFLRASVLRHPEGADLDGRAALLRGLEKDIWRGPFHLEDRPKRVDSVPPPGTYAAQAAERRDGDWLLFEDDRLVDAASRPAELRRWPRVDGRKYVVMARVALQ